MYKWLRNDLAVQISRVVIIYVCGSIRWDILWAGAMPYSPISATQRNVWHTEGTHYKFDE